VNKSALIALLCTLSLAAVAPSRAAGEFKGNWTIAPAQETGKVRFGLIHHMHGGNSHSVNDWPTSAFQGLDLTTRGKRDVQFVITRDAGRFDCKGYLEDGEGAGSFRFAPDASYVKAMNALGYTDIDTEKQFAMAVHDVSLEFARQMKGERLSGLDTDKLIAFRIFNVTPQFIRELRVEGLPASDSDRLIAFRVHGVTPAMVRELKKSGLDADEDELIAMRVHGVSPEFISEMKSRGLENLTIDQLVNLRVHGIN
jgi:hypothetical protein